MARCRLPAPTGLAFSSSPSGAVGRGERQGREKDMNKECAMHNAIDTYTKSPGDIDGALVGDLVLEDARLLRGDVVQGGVLDDIPS